MLLDDYVEFKKRIYQMTSINLDSYKERQMKRRIDSLIERNHCTTYNEYVKLIQGSKELYEEFVNYLTINVSEFFRNPEQWKLLETDIFPKLLSNNKHPKIWSAACSTGDEPYSLVMLLTKFMPLSEIHITATDIDQQIMEKAKLGIYNIKSLKGVPKEYFDKYFRKINDTTYQINDEIKNHVDYKKHNLLKDPYFNDCDLIVCRNVLIYFTELAKEDVYRKFYQSLKEGGYLFIGSTEQIIQAAQMGYVSNHTFFYQKKK